MNKIFFFFILFILSMISYGQKGQSLNQTESIITPSIPVAIKFESENSTKKESTLPIGSVKTSNIKVNYVSIKSIDLNTQKINPYFIVSDDIISNQIDALKVAIKKNKLDKKYVQELKKQLAVLKERRKYLSDNQIN